MKLYFAPDTSDHPNWGCRIMGMWFRHAFARNRTPPSWHTTSRWFYDAHPDCPDLTTMAHLEDCAARVRAGAALPILSAMLKQCDMVFLNGENFIRPEAHKGRMLLMLAYITKTVFGKPCVLSNHTVDLDEPELREIVSTVYPLLDEVHFREETSRQRAGHYVSPGRSRLIPDVAWDVPAAPIEEWITQAGRPGQFCAFPDSAEGFDPARPYVTVCASSVFALPQHKDLDAAPAFTELCRRLNKEVGRVLLTAPCEADARIMRKVQTALFLPLLGINVPVRQAIDVIGNAAVHVGGRWHPTIFAASGGTPSIALSANTHKMHSLMHQTGQRDRVFDVLRLDEQIDDIVAAARNCIEAGQTLRDALRQRSRELRAQVQGNMDCLRSRLAN